MRRKKSNTGGVRQDMPFFDSIATLAANDPGSTTSHSQQKRTSRFYTADAWIEFGIYNVMHDIDLPGDISEEVVYTLTYKANDFTIEVAMKKWRNMVADA